MATLPHLILSVCLLNEMFPVHRQRDVSVVVVSKGQKWYDMREMLTRVSDSLTRVTLIEFLYLLGIRENGIGDNLSQ